MAVTNHPGHNDRREAARAVARLWARNGVPAFPVRIGHDPTLYDGAGGTTKRPATINGHLAATTNLDELDRLFDRATCAPGEVFGAAILPGGGEYVVVDIDLKGGKNGFPAATNLDLLDTWGALTPSGGQHRIFRRPTGVRITNASPWAADGIDIRGDDGWIVAPGTDTPWGKWRKIDDERKWPDDVADLPADVLERLTTTTSTAGHTVWNRLNEENTAKLDPATRRAVDALVATGGHSPILREREGREPWVEITRPGKRDGTSASVGYVGPGIVRSFTPNWPGVPEGRNEIADDGRIVPAGTRFDEWAARVTSPPPHVDPDTGEIVADDDPSDTWQPISLRYDPNRPVVLPSILRRDDGHALFTPGHVHVIFGEPEAGKGWLICAAIREVVTAGRNAVYIDLEDTEHNIGPRLRGLGLTDDQLDAHVTYLRPQDRTNQTTWARLCAYAEDADLVVIDSFNEVIGLWGVKSKDNDEITPFVRNVPRALAHLGPAVVLADHVVKNREERSRYPIGAQAKLAAADAGYSIENTTRFGRGKTGRSTISVAKDRHGHVRAATVGGDHWGTYTLTSNEGGGQITFDLTAKVTGGDGDTWRPTGLMEKISKMLAEHGGEMSKNKIEGLAGAKAEYVRKALELLVDEGYATVRKQGSAHYHRHAKPYREADELATSSPRPTSSHLVPGTRGGNLVPSSPSSTNGRGDEDEVRGRSEGAPRPKPKCRKCDRALDRGGCRWCDDEDFTDDWIDPRKDLQP